MIVVPEKLVFYIIGNVIAFVVPIVLILAYDKIKGIPKGEDEEEKKIDIPKTVEKELLYAVVDGNVIPIEQIGDGVFSNKVLGNGIGIIPDSEIVVAPADGTICTIIEDSKHAVGITLNNGINILVHVGIDTVAMNGEGFKYFVNMGDKVKKGDKLLSFDKKRIHQKGYNPVVIVVELEEGQGETIHFISGKNVKAAQDLIGE